MFDPLEKMIFEKCSKQYKLSGTPASLLLYYAVGHQVPCVKLVRAYLSESRERIYAALKASDFGTIYFYDDWTNAVFATVGGESHSCH